MKPLIPLLALALASVGCVTTRTIQQASSGWVGCPPGDIAITDFDRGFGAASWTAVCHGTKYYCSTIGQGGTKCTAAH